MQADRLFTLGCFLTALSPALVTAQGDGQAMRRVTTILDRAGRVDYSAKLDLLAIDRQSGSEYFEIFTVRTDGSNLKCLTCDRPELPPRHKGNPSWHPSGDYILFQAEKDLDISQLQGAGQQQRRRGIFGRRRARRMQDPERMEKVIDFYAAPGAGFRNDVWVMDRDGRRFWKLTDTDPKNGGILHPHFSPRGDRILWAERVRGKEGIFGVWELKVADFTAGGGNARISNVRTISPVRRFYESHGFSPDGSKILFTGDVQRGDKELALDIYTYDLRTKKLENLTDSPDAWDEHAHFSPSGKHIVWMSTQGLRMPDKPVDAKCDWWMMNADGSEKRRVSDFNVPGSKDYRRNGVCAADFSWGRDGSTIFGLVIDDNKERRGRIVRVDLAREY